MMYRALKNGKHPISQRDIKKGEIIDLFHTVGDIQTKGKGAWLVRSKKIDKNTAIALKSKIEEDGAE